MASFSLPTTTKAPKEGERCGPHPVLRAEQDSDKERKVGHLWPGDQRQWGALRPTRHSFYRLKYTSGFEVKLSVVGTRNYGREVTGRNDVVTKLSP